MTVKSKMIARRCSICAIDWPDTDEFIDCPKCEVMTRRFVATPMDLIAAKSLKKHVEFDAFYENEWLPRHSVEPSHLPSLC